MKYAIVQNGVVSEIVEAADTAELGRRYHPDLLKNFVAMDANSARMVRQGWRYDGAAFASPLPQPQPDPNIGKMLQDAMPANSVMSDMIPAAAVIAKLSASGKLKPFAQKLLDNPDLLLRLIFVMPALSKKDANVRRLLREIGVTPADVLPD